MTDFVLVGLHDLFITPKLKTKIGVDMIFIITILNIKNLLQLVKWNKNISLKYLKKENYKIIK